MKARLCFSRMSVIRLNLFGSLIIFFLLNVLLITFTKPLASQVKASAQQNMVGDATVEDYTDIVTHADLGYNDFAGNTGDINNNGQLYGKGDLVCSQSNSCVLRFKWDFGIDDLQNASTGRFFSLFGLTDTQATFDGKTTQKVFFPEHTLNLDQIDGHLIEPSGPRRFDALRIALTYQGSEELKLRVELKDVQGGGRFKRFTLRPTQNQSVLSWDFRNPRDYRIAERDLDVRQVKVFSFIIEREVDDEVKNPISGSLDIRHISFIPNRLEIEPSNDTELLDLLERRTFQYFLDWTSRKPKSQGIPQDRSTFGDLLTIGGIGFGLPAYVIGAERGWISRTEAAEQTLAVLRILDDQTAFGPDRIGRIGYKGWFYHFLGVDGRRKLNFDFKETPYPQDESKNTVELSAIDTGLALMGVLTAQSYFDRLEESEIRSRAQNIYDRVDWPFLLECTSKQFYLGWKPKEEREGSPFNIPDAAGEGDYSSKLDGSPATLDFYTDEAPIVTLLAVGSTTHQVPVEVHCAWKRKGNGFIRSFPGSLFTYQFLHAFLNTNTKEIRFPACPDEQQIDWYENSCKAHFAVIDYAEKNPCKFPTYGPDAWGISAAEGPDDMYRAYGAPSAALNPCPEQDGTVTYYGMLSATSFGNDLRARAIRALRKAWQRGHWNIRFGLPDAFHDEISKVCPDKICQSCPCIVQGSDNRLRKDGPWVQRALFAIDQGPMLLHLENAKSGLIWKLIEKNPNIQKALGRLAQPKPPVITGFVPSSGQVGTTVTISGAKLLGTTSVGFNSVNASFNAISDSSITATVPAGATTGPISVTNAAGTTISIGNFTVINIPTITGFVPSRGQVGTTVTISGAKLLRTTAVKFNGVNASFNAISDSSITTTVPAGATTGPISVTNAAGTTISIGNFTVINIPAITGFVPSRGQVGTTVTISGAKLLGTTAVRFNGVNASFNAISDSSVTTTVPAGATTGPISVINADGSFTSTTNFVVLPQITGFMPSEGKVGTVVAISGSGFSSVTEVRFNGQRASFNISATDQITATVPQGATTGAISVVTQEGIFNSTSMFTVINLTITGASFRKPNLFVNGSGFGLSGAQVRINGSDVSSRIANQTDVSITLKGNKKKLNLRNGANQIVVIADGVLSNTFVLNLLTQSKE